MLRKAIAPFLEGKKQKQDPPESPSSTPKPTPQSSTPKTSSPLRKHLSRFPTLITSTTTPSKLAVVNVGGGVKLVLLTFPCKRNISTWDRRPGSPVIANAVEREPPQTVAYSHTAHLPDHCAGSRSF